MLIQLIELHFFWCLLREMKHRAFQMSVCLRVFLAFCGICSQCISGNSSTTEWINEIIQVLWSKWGKMMLSYDMKPVLLQCSYVLQNHKIRIRRYLERSSSPSASLKAWSSYTYGNPGRCLSNLFVKASIDIHDKWFFISSMQVYVHFHAWAHTKECLVKLQTSASLIY